MKLFSLFALSAFIFSSESLKFSQEVHYSASHLEGAEGTTAEKSKGCRKFHGPHIRKGQKPVQGEEEQIAAHLEGKAEEADQENCPRFHPHPRFGKFGRRERKPKQGQNVEEIAETTAAHLQTENDEENGVQSPKCHPRFGGKKPHGPRSWKGKRPSQKDEVAKDEAAETEETAAAHLEGENTENNDGQISIHPHPHSRPHGPHRRGPRGQKPEKTQNIENSGAAE